MSDSVITQLKASPVRRGFALLVMMLLGFLLLYLTMTTDASFFHKVFLVAVAAAVLWMARAMQRGTTGYIEPRKSGFFFEVGRTLTLIGKECRARGCEPSRCSHPGTHSHCCSFESDE